MKSHASSHRSSSYQYNGQNAFEDDSKESKHDEDVRYVDVIVSSSKNENRI